MKWLLTHFMALPSFNAPWKQQETSGFLMYFQKHRKKPVPGNGLMIFLTNMSAECWYSCLVHNRAHFITVDLQWFFRCTQEVWNLNVFWIKLISRNTTQWLLPGNVHGNQLKQSTVFIIAYILKTTSWKK